MCIYMYICVYIYVCIYIRVYIYMHDSIRDILKCKVSDNLKQKKDQKEANKVNSSIE